MTEETAQGAAPGRAGAARAAVLAGGAVAVAALASAPPEDALLALLAFPAVPALVGSAAGLLPALLVAAAGTAVGALGPARGAWTPLAAAAAASWVAGAAAGWARTAAVRARSARDDLAGALAGAHEALRERERALEHATRVATVGNLAAMVAHQLRNAFQLMMGHASLGAKESTADQERRLAGIREQIGAASSLLEQLLDLAHPGETRARRVDLARLCARFGDTVRRMLPAAIELQVDLPQREVPVILDPRGLEHALLNLVINARQAISGAGKLRLALTADASTARLELSDDGAGIAEADLEHIFEPYFTTKPTGEGTGLGLATVDWYVRSVAGRISVESELGRGTTFRLEFPLHETERRQDARVGP